MTKRQERALQKAIDRLSFDKESNGYTDRNKDSTKMRDLNLYLKTWVLPLLNGVLKNDKDVLERV